MRGVRGRLTVTLVALVATTAAVLGIGSYAFVDAQLHDQRRGDAAAQARFDLSVLGPNLLDPAPSLEALEASNLGATLSSRGVGLVVDLPGEPYVSGFNVPVTPAGFSEALRTAVGRGELAYEWTRLGGRPVLVLGGLLQPSGPPFYFVHDATDLEATLEQLRVALGVGALVLIVVALLAARLVARGVLAPVEVAARAAERIEQGDLSARVPVTSRDEFGAWAERFNRMASALADTIARLEGAQAQNRRFVADVSHELRTPLAALVAEASLLRESLDRLPPDARRAAELLVADVGRLRLLVDDLMEVSRFDAHAEQVASQAVDIVPLVGNVVAGRLPGATLRVPPGPLVVETDARRLERILGNLLDNAREHATGSEVEVSLDVDGGRLLLAVADRGPGVDPDRLDRIFDRFFKADPSRHGGSSGLGLAIAAEHAALLGGELRAANRPGGGLRIELVVPVTQPLPAGDTMAIGRSDGEPPDTSVEEATR